MFRWGPQVEKSGRRLRNWETGVFPCFPHFSRRKRNMKWSWRANHKSDHVELYQFGVYSVRNEKTLQGFKQGSDMIWFASIKRMWTCTRVKQECKWRYPFKGYWKHRKGRQEWARRNWREIERYEAYFRGKNV